MWLMLAMMIYVAIKTSSNSIINYGHFMKSSLSLHRVKRRKTDESSEGQETTNESPKGHSTPIIRRSTPRFDIKNAWKRAKFRRRKRKVLFQNKSDDMEIIQSLMPEVVKNFGVHKLKGEFIAFLKLVGSGPHTHGQYCSSAVIRRSEVVFFGKHQTMTYPETTKLFWRIGMKLFHGSFLHFMSGNKNKGQYTELENPSPEASTINFAVPEPSVLRNFQPLDVMKKLPSEISPGIIDSTLNLIENKDKFKGYDEKDWVRSGKCWVDLGSDIHKPIIQTNDDPTLKDINALNQWQCDKTI